MLFLFLSLQARGSIHTVIPLHGRAGSQQHYAPHLTLACYAQLEPQTAKQKALVENLESCVLGGVFPHPPFRQ